MKAKAAGQTYSVKDWVRIKVIRPGEDSYWLDGRIVAKTDQQYTVTFEAWRDYTEVVGPDQLKRIPLVPDPPRTRGPYEVGEEVVYFNMNCWYKGRIAALSARGPTVWLDGFASVHDAVVTVPQRLKRLATAKAERLRITKGPHFIVGRRIPRTPRAAK